jgi:transcriptional regulator with XRE-family HTH domain
MVDLNFKSMAKLTQIQKLDLIPSAIEAYLSDNSTTQVALAKLAGIDKAYVNQIAKSNEFIGKAKIADKYYEAIALAIGYKLEVTHWQHFNTFNFKLACVSIDAARIKKERLGIDGLTGLGKTYISTAYKRKFPKQVIVIKCSAIHNAKEFAKEFAEAVGITPIGTKGFLIKQACKAVKNIGDNPIVMIDEFENSKLSHIIPTIKVISDELEGCASVIIIGIGVKKMLQDAAEREKNGFVQVNRRWSFSWVKLDPNISEDIGLICDELGIKNRAAQNWLKNRVHDLDSLKRICVSALEEAEISGQEVTISLLNELFPL